MLNLISKILCQNNSGFMRKMSWGFFGWFYILVWVFFCFFLFAGRVWAFFGEWEFNKYIERNLWESPHFNETESKQ